MLNDDENDTSNKFSTLASYIILEGYYENKNLNTISFNLIKVPYDIQKEVDDIRKSDMPNKEIIIRSLTSAIPNINKLQI